MKKFMITAWTFATVLVSDVEFGGADVVIGVYVGTNEDDAKKQASNEHNIPIEELKANQIL